MKRLIRRIMKKPALRICYKGFMWFLKKCVMMAVNTFVGVKPNKIVFRSFYGMFYSDNPKAISEKLYQIDQTYDIVWLFIDPVKKSKIVPPYVRCVKEGSLESLKELATAGFWVDNFRKPTFFYKSKEQIYIQTWHGDKGFKKILYDEGFPPNSLIEPRILDLAVSGSQLADSVYRTAFGYRGEIYTYGTPRNDQLVENDAEHAALIKKEIGVRHETKIILYAPTFRDSKRGKPQSFGGIQFQEILDKLKSKTGEKWVCLFRAHSADIGFEKQKHINGNVIDVTAYEDMADLLLVSDFLITDYSSTAGDFALLGRPIILYQYDRDVYIKNDRMFYFDMDQSPYVIAITPKELIRALEEFDLGAAAQNCREILEFYGSNETGKASEKIAEYIIAHTGSR